jgi:hypothetical protein
VAELRTTGRTLTHPSTSRPCKRDARCDDDCTSFVIWLTRPARSSQRRVGSCGRRWLVWSTQGRICANDSEPDLMVGKLEVWSSR